MSVLLIMTGSAGANPDSLSSYQTANGLLSRGLHELAIPEYRAFLEGNESHEHAETAWYGLGVCLHRTGSYEEAVEAFSRIRGGPSFRFAGETALLIGDALLRLGRFEDAATTLDRVPSTASRETARSMRALRVEALHRAGDHARAARAGREVLRDGAIPRVRLLTGLSLAALGDDAGAIEVLEPAQRSSDTEDLVHQQSLLALAQAHQKLGHIEQSQQAYRGLTRSTVSGIRLPSLLGAAQIARVAGEDQRASELLGQLAREQLDPSMRSTVSYEQGLVRFSQGRDADAIRAFREVREGDLMDDASYWSARASRRSGDPRGAKRVLLDAIDAYPRSNLAPEMRYEHGLACLELVETDEAIASFDLLASNYPSHALAPEAIHASATALANSGDYEGATERCEAFARIAPDHPLAPDVTLLHAESARQTGQGEDAARLCSRFLRAWPGHTRESDARFIRGMSHAGDGEVREALHDLRKVTAGDAYDAKHAPALYALAQIEFQAGHWGEADRLFARYLTDRPDGASVHDARLRRGLALARLEEHEDAIGEFQSLVRTSTAPTALRERALFEYGQSMLALGRDADASRAFEQVVAKSPESETASVARRHLGDLAMRAGDASKAGGLYEASGDDGSGSHGLRLARASLLSGDAAAAADRLGRLLESGDSLGADTDLARALYVLALSRQGDHERVLREAARIERSASLPNTERRAVALACAVAKRESGDLVISARVLREIVNEDASDTTGSYAGVELASMLLDENMPERALRTLDASSDAIERSENPAMIARSLYIRAASHHGLAQHERVIETLDGFAERFPESRIVHAASLLLGDSCVAIGRHIAASGPLGLACESADDEIRSPAMLRHGEAMASTQNWAASLRSYEGHALAFPDHPLRHEALFGIGRALEHLGRYADAETKYREVVDAHAGELAAHALFQIGECAFAQGEHERAVREFLRVDILFAYDEWSAGALYEAGRCFEQMNKPGDARAQYRAVLERFGDSPWAAAARERLGAMTGRGDVPGRRGV